MIPLRDDIRRRQFPAVNWLLILLNVWVFVMQAIGMVPDRYAAVPRTIMHGHAVYTIVTSMFMHGGLLHILGNMWFLYIFGDNVEDAFGHLGYLAIYLVSGILGALLQIAAAPHSAIPMLGASGAISGVLGAYMVLYPGARILTLLPVFFLLRINVPAVVFLGIWIIVQVLSGLGTPRTGGGVAFFAHIGGFAFGLAAGIIARISRSRHRIRYSVY